MIKKQEETIGPTYRVRDSAFVKELTSLVNKYNIEQESNTPDFILVEYIVGCLQGFNYAIKQRERWYKSKEDEL